MKSFLLSLCFLRDLLLDRFLHPMLPPALANEGDISALENAVLSPDTFEVSQPDSMFIPYSDTPHPSGPLQRFDAQAGKALANAFHGLVGRARRTLNPQAVPIYVGHPDVKAVQALYPDRGAKGWVTGITPEADGVRVAVKWNAEGTRLLENAVYRFYSPFWLTEDVSHGVTRPFQLVSIGLTNTPNIRVPALANDQTSETEPMKLTPQLLALLGLSEGFEVTALENAITAIHTRATTAEGTLQSNVQALANATNGIDAATTKANAAEAKITALANDLTAAKEALVQTGIASLQQTGHLVPADVANERTRILALANVADITTELKRLAGQAPKIKMHSITVDAPGSQGKVQALANDALARRDEFNGLVRAKRQSLENSGIHPSKSYDLAFNEVSRTNGDLLKAVA